MNRDNEALGLKAKFSAVRESGNRWRIAMVCDLDGEPLTLHVEMPALAPANIAATLDRVSEAVRAAFEADAITIRNAAKDNQSPDVDAHLRLAVNEPGTVVDWVHANARIDRSRLGGVEVTMRYFVPASGDPSTIEDKMVAEKCRRLARKTAA